MTAKTILVPTDFSPTAEAALKYAALLARDLNAQLLITYVHAVPELAGAYGDVYDPSEIDERHRLESVRPSGIHAPFRHLFLIGRPSETIVHAACESHADMIVMGAHGQTNSPASVMGSVAVNVLQRAACPVLTIHLPGQTAVSK